MWIRPISLGLVTALTLLVSGCNPPAPSASPPTTVSPTAATDREQIPPTSVSGSRTETAQAGQNLLLGNPSDASTSSDNYLVERAEHSLSYSKSNGGPNWVAWHLDRSDLGSARRSSFMPDPLLPPDMQIRPNDYRGSGYDRGHVCPSGDRTRNHNSNQATFVMSNMLPQAAELNREVWKRLEEYERSLARSGNELYIYAGGSGSAGRIAGGRINVPAICWKIIVALPVGEDDLSRVDSDTRVIAVAMPNRDRPEIGASRWAQWITTVDQIEKSTGFNFLSALPPAIEGALEQKRDSGRARVSAREAGNAVPLTPESSTPAPSIGTPETAVQPVSPPSPTGSSGSGQIPSGSVTGETGPSREVPAPTRNEVTVWVNTRSGIYHYPGTRYYGKTREGSYMSEGQAQAGGYRAAQNGQ